MTPWIDSTAGVLDVCPKIQLHLETPQAALTWATVCSINYQGTNYQELTDA